MAKKRLKRTHTCRGKRRFRDHGEAIHALHKVRADSVRQVVPTRAYKCHLCNGFHLTSQA